MTTTLDELLATIAEDAGTAPRPATAPPIPPKVDEIDLDDGPVLASDRLWPAAIPQPRRKGPPPPPPGRRARGTAPLGESIPSGLIDVRALASGTEPISRVEPEAEAERRWRPSPALLRAAVVAAIGGALAAAALLASSFLDRGQREETETFALVSPLEEDVTVTAGEPLQAPPLVITAQPELGLDAPLEVRVIPLPTQVTEVAAAERPAEPSIAVARPPVRTARTRVPVDVSAVAGILPMRPSNSEIASAVVAVQKRLNTCGDLHGTTGPVPVKLRVAPSGAIASIAVNQGTTTFRSCVASALRRQRLPASQVGTTASFPVLIR